jgi:hypothetical protein
MLRRAMLMALLVAMATPAMAVKSGRVKYRGGTIDMKEGKEAPYTFTEEGMAVSPKPKDGPAWTIPFAEVTKIVYGQPTGVQWVSFSKSKKHFVTVSWTGEQVTIEFDKSDINKALAMLSAKSGVEVEHIEEGSK